MYLFSTNYHYMYVESVCQDTNTLFQIILEEISIPLYVNDNDIT